MNKYTTIKCQRLGRSNVKRESSDSCSSTSNFNYVQTESESSCGSEFEEHPYSVSKKRKLGSTSKIAKRLLIDSDSNWSALNSRVISKPNNKRQSKCNSKNAIMARINRLKKKKYIADLETKNAKLETENEILKNMLARRKEEVATLQRETINLRNVIKNSTEIGSILKCIHRNTNLQISSSLLENISNDSQPSPSLSKDIVSRPTSGFDVSASKEEEEACVAAVLWGMALHTFCQPYKQSSPNNSAIWNKKKSDE